MAKITKEQEIEINNLYKSGKSIATIAREFGVSTSTIRNRLDEESLKILSEKTIRITEEQEKEINYLYQQGETMAELARRFNTGPQTIKRHLNEESLKKMAEQEEDKEALYYYIYKLFNQEVSGHNWTQMEKFRRQGINYRAQLLTLKYFYEVCHHTTERSNNSIGIIPYVASDASAYWLKELQKRREFEVELKKQLEQDRLVIPYTPPQPRKRKKKEIDLSTLEESN